MRDRIACALTRVLRLLLPARGRHRTTAPPTAPVVPVPEPVPVSPWTRPWTGPSSATARAIFTAPETRGLTLEQRERFYATAWAELGRDYPHAAASGETSTLR
ncbi:hypothetical protein [Streptomyces clavuligerus]|uniref:Uncharacterized protein n=1 Tax=Streptomyces clavuligerus TaxID=1901 RepID=B5GKY9_STRCL|nr:hypothetical protein [Streptomyces clavuligerus]AXU12573.1 hypothetical protein D1794_07435 [Streptomyces clavuligerus]EDY46985.1 hypothetical protein SSCG_00013 [Streptomyces clavuligerus]EFG09411.1 Hypothetical protein SCLAV_4338 [Streptomyces clavuligerus]QCS05354.1 hypothetical protein CRV15_06865 [Streptomyces clavuligerus]QPJ95274.1 hypothetical protein GE265_21040 [Streptomyces clavuligerus]